MNDFDKICLVISIEAKASSVDFYRDKLSIKQRQIKQQANIKADTQTNRQRGTKTNNTHKQRDKKADSKKAHT